MTSHHFAPPRRGIIAEIAIVLGLSVGASAVCSIVAIINRLTREEALSQQTATLNSSLSDRQVFDLIYQLLSVFFNLMPVALVCYLLYSGMRPHLSRLGLTFERPARDIGRGRCWHWPSASPAWPSISSTARSASVSR